MHDSRKEDGLPVKSHDTFMVCLDAKSAREKETKQIHFGEIVGFKRRKLEGATCKKKKKNDGHPFIITSFSRRKIIYNQVLFWK